MSNDFRETTVRVYGLERVVRTEGQRTVKQLEAAHTKAVKAALEEMHTTELDRIGAEDMASLERKRWKDREGWAGSGARAKENAISQAKESHEKRRLRKFNFPKCNWVDARKGWPKVSSTTAVPDYLDEIAPGEYATREAAETMTRAVDETLPGLSLERCGDGWTFRHLASATDEKPHGVSLGTVFKTRERARQVADEELSGVDWTRSADELQADEVLSARMRLIKARERVARKPSDVWAQEDLRKAEAELSAAA
jgi:hypothetical protein